MAVTYSTRPSSFLGLPPDSWEAFQVDLACLRTGREIENKLAERDKQGKPVHTVSSILRSMSATDERPAVQASEFASLKQFAVTKMAIPESGIW